MNIRESRNTDINAIQDLHEEAFGEPEGKVIAQLVGDIFEDETAKPLLSLIVEANDEIVGNIIFSSLNVEGHPNVSAYILAPLAICSQYQRQGWGMKLINTGLEKLKDNDADIVLVLGDPNYYQRSGFSTGHHLQPPYPLEYPDAWMALELKPGTLIKAKGMVHCASALSSAEYW